jgi:hypothetical protein
MNKSNSIQEQDPLTGLVRSAWVHLNQAGDTPDSHRSILSLQAALEEILSVDGALHADSTLESAIARHHHSFLKSQPNAPDILRALSTRALEIRNNPKAPAENVPDALLVHSAIPVIWRMIRGIRHELQRGRALPYYVELVRCKAKGVLAPLVGGCILAMITWLLLPWGCIVTYQGSGVAAPVRGWSMATALVKDYGTGRPLPWMRRDGWSARWDGFLLVPESADYSFFAQCEGGLRLWLDGELLVDHWSSPGWTRGEHAQRNLQPGLHALRMEFRDRGGSSALRVRWAGGPIPPNTVIGFPYLRKY